MFSLNEKIIIITGGYGYLGRSMVEALLKFGAKVIVFGKNKSKFCDAFSAYDRVEFIRCDLSNSKNIIEACEEVIDKYSKIDVLINNAYFVSGEEPLNISDNDWSLSLDICLSSIYRICKKVVPYMAKKQEGKIINIGSMYGSVAPKFNLYKEPCLDFMNPPSYGVSKAGVIQLTKYLASYLGKEGITVNCISPGAFPSNEVQLNKVFVKRLEEETVLGRIGNPSDLNGLIVLLSSNASNYITGQNITVDGGWTIR